MVMGTSTFAFTVRQERAKPTAGKRVVKDGPSTRAHATCYTPGEQVVCDRQQHAGVELKVARELAHELPHAVQPLQEHRRYVVGALGAWQHGVANTLFESVAKAQPLLGDEHTEALHNEQPGEVHGEHHAGHDCTYTQRAVVGIQQQLSQRYNLSSPTDVSTGTARALPATDHAARTCEVLSHPSLQCVSTEVPLGKQHRRHSSADHVSREH